MNGGIVRPGSSEATPWSVPLPAYSGGRLHRTRRRVRVSDVDKAGRVRFDGLARYLQDVASDDVRDAGVEDEVAWVVRRTTIVAEPKPVFGEDLELSTWCSGTGTALAERRTTITGSRQARVEAVSLWVCLDRVTMRPVPLRDEHFAPYRESAGSRRVRGRFLLPSAPASLPRVRWPLRSSDYDPYDHLNNAVSWTAAQEEAGRRGIGAGLTWGQVEYRLPIDSQPAVEVVAEPGDDVLSVWLLGPDGLTATSAHLGPTRPGG